jgi:hypothetical protein
MVTGTVANVRAGAVTLATYLALTLSPELRSIAVTTI